MAEITFQTLLSFSFCFHICLKISSNSLVLTLLFKKVLASYFCFLNALHSFHFLGTLNTDFRVYSLFIVYPFPPSSSFLFIFMILQFHTLNSFLKFLIILGCLSHLNVRHKIADRKLCAHKVGFSDMTGYKQNLCSEKP